MVTKCPVALARFRSSAPARFVSSSTAAEKPGYSLNVLTTNVLIALFVTYKDSPGKNSPTSGLMN